MQLIGSSIAAGPGGASSAGVFTYSAPLVYFKQTSPGNLNWSGGGTGTWLTSLTQSYTAVNWTASNPILWVVVFSASAGSGDWSGWNYNGSGGGGSCVRAVLDLRKSPANQINGSGGGTIYMGVGEGSARLSNAQRNFPNSGRAVQDYCCHGAGASVICYAPMAIGINGNQPSLSDLNTYSLVIAGGGGGGGASRTANNSMPGGAGGHAGETGAELAQGDFGPTPVFPEPDFTTGFNGQTVPEKCWPIKLEINGSTYNANQAGSSGPGGAGQRFYGGNSGSYGGGGGGGYFGGGGGQYNETSRMSGAAGGSSYVNRSVAVHYEYFNGTQRIGAQPISGVGDGTRRDGGSYGSNHQAGATGAIYYVLRPASSLS